MSTPAEQDPFGIDAAQFLSTIRSMMEEYTTDCFCAVDEAMIRPPHNLSCEEQSLLLKGSTLLYDMAMRRVRNETQRFESEALQGSLGQPAGLDFSDSRPLPGTQDSQGAQEESKLDAEMAEMRTRLAVIQREVHLLTAPAAKLRACLEANGPANKDIPRELLTRQYVGRRKTPVALKPFALVVPPGQDFVEDTLFHIHPGGNAERSHDSTSGTLLGKENIMDDAAAVHTALQHLQPLLNTCQQLQQSARANDHAVKIRSTASVGGSGVTPMQGKQLDQLCDIRSAVPGIMALLDQEG